MNDEDPVEPGCVRSVVSTVLLAAVLIAVLGLLFWLMSAPTSA
jgi:hypothetical protein